MKPEKFARLQRVLKILVLTLIFLLAMMVLFTALYIYEQ